MSALNFVVMQNKIVVMTDSALYRRDGVVLQFACKISPIENWSGAIWGRGNHVALILLQALANCYESLDDLVEAGAEEYEQAFRDHVESGAIVGWLNVDGFVAGWSDRLDRLAIYRLSSEGITENAFRWGLFDDEWNMGPSLRPCDYWLAQRLGVDPIDDWTPETFDPVRHGIPLMEIQRLSLAAHETDDERHAIGGGVWVAEVKRNGVTTSQIHSWPDHVGERVAITSPFKDVPLRAPSWIPDHRKSEWLALYRAGKIGDDMKFPPRPPIVERAGNRAERRRLEKMARKTGRA